MQDLKKDLRLALVQLEPVLFDKAACLGNTLKKLAEAAENGAEFIVFPELSIPGYPFGMTFGWRIVKLSATPLRNRPHMVFCSQGTS
ncbi:Aliphatic nitrilase [Mitsuokella jalaludinii]|uniref:Aliphatic nitrilase n=1 Tax=Mitsuokella jalaludinii TaxID=187979 RepID=A0A174AV63_9FIRM|nr:Aliphatic nitrilase [Mitsuokella jalaludinii]